MANTEVTKLQPHKLPALVDLISDKELAIAQDDLNLILNTPVPQAWVKEHPMVKIKVTDPQGVVKSIPLPYIPVRKVKYLLKRIYGKYELKITNVGQILNAVYVTGTITVTNPVTGEKESQDGCGAAQIQMDAGATQGDLSKIKANAIQIGLPSAESYALKNAAEKLGDIFGGNIYDIDASGYQQVFTDEVRDSVYNKWDDLQTLYDLKKEAMTENDRKNADRVIQNKEEKSYKKLYTQMKGL